MEDDGRDQKILDPDIQLTATCVRVPVFIGHSEAVTVEFEQPITAQQARAILREAPAYSSSKARGRRLHHADRVAGEDATYCRASARIRRSRHGLALWV